MSTETRTRILLADSCGADRDVWKRLLAGRESTYTFLEAATVEEAGRLLAEHPDCVLLDCRLAEDDAVAFLRDFRGRDGILGCPPVVLTGMPDDALELQSVRAGAHDHLVKGRVDAEVLSRSIRYSMERHRLIRELHDANCRAHHLATHCPLTGLPNRELLLDRVSRAVATARRQERLVALLFIDLDGFKGVNDTFGHLGGDYVLRAVAERFRRNRRATDTLARVGGDEFAILLTHPARSIDAGRVAETVLATLDEPIHINEASVTVRASAGIAIFPENADSPEDLVQRADSAMYRAKTDGGAAVRFHSDQMTRIAHSRLDLENRLRNALASRRLSLRYLPRIDMERRQVSAVEALPRWSDPDLGNVPPSEFIALAEETDLIDRLGRWMLRRACQQNRRWQAAGLRRVPVSVRISPMQIGRTDLAQVVRDVLSEGRLEGRFLELELGESCFSRDLTSVVRVLDDLRSLGVRVTVGDFGKGACSLSALRRLPVDLLKIDRSFIQELGDGGQSASIAASVIALTRSFGLEPVADGVESLEQLEFLIEHGCHNAQGLLFAPALSETEVRGLLSPDGNVLDALGDKADCD